MSPELAVGIKRSLELLLLPPAGPLWLVLLGLWVGRTRAATGRAIAVLGVVLALAFSTQGVGRRLVAPLEREAGPALDEAALRALMARGDAPQAVVILGGGLRSDRHERPHRYRPHPRTTERLLYGAWAARVTGLPVLVSGGVPRGAEVSEAALMKRSLETQLSTRVRWVEDRSLDSADNARASAELLLADKRRRVLLVTHAVHMVRARAAFEKAGLEPVAAPTGFLGTPVHSDWREWLPSADGAAINWLALHEIAGRLWYRLRGLN
ncbi:MAG TPA: YdcF family protein [Burkholderiaceae bacterium]|nr:YdcF family protein [Burkholderiaceae bacterium]